ncbi:hypothetical protein [Vibrio phage vB_VmeM-Yong XC32]|nr:hypothetical protein [Vibrio phage vB_VmeM-Yong XC31]QAX96590.1 hypothetical protein [Vibrio phage vB_VmeM-Yong XC32]QAX96908.1 hypothetical protein [Vibrio phage vB_VmeM-Yong MS31]QAX97213.1 hypothetical protein [Vibrio phage vB_VmeM-Yong MS32]
MKFLNIARAMFFFDTFNALGTRYMEIMVQDPDFPAQLEFTGEKHCGQWSWAQAAGFRLAEYFDAKGTPKLIFHSGSERMWEDQSEEIVASAYDIFILDLRIERNFEFFNRYRKQLEKKHIIVVTDSSMTNVLHGYIQQECTASSEKSELYLSGEYAHIATAVIPARKNTSYRLHGEMNLREQSYHMDGNPADIVELRFFEDVLMGEDDLRDNDVDDDIPGGYRLEQKPMWFKELIYDAGNIKMFYKDQYYEDEEVKELFLTYDPSANRIGYAGGNATGVTYLRIS